MKVEIDSEILAQIRFKALCISEAVYHSDICAHLAMAIETRANNIVELLNTEQTKRAQTFEEAEYALSDRSLEGQEETPIPEMSQEEYACVYSNGNFIRHPVYERNVLTWQNAADAQRYAKYFDNLGVRVVAVKSTTRVTAYL